MAFDDRFELGEAIQTSPHGGVWAAQDTKFGRSVLVTRLNADAHEAVRARFEALVSGGIATVRVMTLARVVDAALDADGRPYLVTERVSDAPTLAERFVDGPAVSVADATRCVVDLLGALTKLGKAGLIHGDIEPAQIRLVEQRGRLSPRLIGLGLNRAAVREGAAPLDDEAHLGTLRYMAPEQGASLGAPRADVYSAAAVLYAWVTGSSPFAGDDVDAIRAAARAGELATVSALRPKLAGSNLAAVIDQALHKDPSKRFRDAPTLAQKLRGAILKTPVARDLEVPVGAREASAPSPAAPASAEKTEEELEFERVSGLLMVPDDGPPQRLGPRPPPAPKRAKKESPPPPPESERAGRPSDGLESLLADIEGDLDVPAPAAVPAEAVAVSGEAEPQDAEADGAEADGAEADGAKADGAEADGAEADGAEADGAEADRAEADRAKAGGAEADRAEADRAKADGAPAATEAAASGAGEDGAETSEATEGEAAVTEEAAPVGEASDDKTSSLPPAGADRISAIHDDPVEDYVLPKRSRPWPWIGAGVGVAAVALLGVGWALSGGETPEDSGTTAAASEPVALEAEEEEEPEAEEPEEIAEPEIAEPEEAIAEPRTLTLTGLPEGATVLVGGQPIEGSELTLLDEPLQVEVQAAGFEPWQATLDASSESAIAVELVEAPTEEGEGDEEGAEEETEAAPALTPAQRRRRARARALARQRRRARQQRRRGSDHPLVGPNPF